MTGRRVLGIGRRRVVVGVSAVCVLLCLLCLLRVVDGFDGAWEDAFGPSERANERPLVDDEKGTVTVVQPNEDGSYWRKIVRNKMIRMKEKRRELAAAAFAADEFAKGSVQPNVVSSWGPYTSTVGTATITGVAGLTAPAKSQ